MATARDRLINLLSSYSAESRDAALADYRAEQLKLTADVLEVANPDRSAEFSEGVDWAIATIRSAAEKSA